MIGSATQAGSSPAVYLNTPPTTKQTLRCRRGNSWNMGANIAGNPRRFPPYLCPEGLGGYRRKCDEVALSGYEGFVFAS